ncbi:TonB-dependent receptor [Methylobacterium sp.]|uniref:TonB-dependent receptor n=1 Tax=Methylobacterium sp. TaxID=409 RepID=UPI003C7885F6
MRTRRSRIWLAGTMLSGAGLTSGAMVAPVAAQQAEATLSELSVTSASPILPAPGSSAVGGFPTGVLPVVGDSFSPVTVVTRSEIQRNQPRTLGDALSDRPGISSSTYAPGAASRPIIRGLDNARVRIQENGIVNGGVSDLGEDHAVPVNPLTADRIEVIRGPATLRYGSGAIGGVVSSENNQVPTFIPARGVSGQVTTGYSSVDNGRLGAASVDAGANGIAVHADGFKTATDSYAIPGGIQRNSATETQGGSIGISAIGDRGFLGVSFSHYEAMYQIPGGESEETRSSLNPKQDRVLARGEYRPLQGPFEVLRFWAGGSVYRHEEIGLAHHDHEHEHDHEEVAGPEGVQAIFKNREVEARFEAQHVPVVTALGTLTGAVGVQTSRRVLNSQLESFLPPTESRSLAAYLFEELAVGGGLRFQAAGRIGNDRLNSIATLFPADYLPGGIDPSSYALTRRFAPKSLSFGALQDLPYGFVASINGSYVERAPTSYELFSQGPHHASATFEIGDPTLKLERARTMELSLRRAEGPLRLDATGYVTRYTGFIYRRDTGNRCDDDFASCGSGDELRQIVYSQANTTFYGAEIGAQLDIVPVGDGWAGIEAQYDFVRAQFDDGSYVPRIPPHRLGGGAFLRANGWFGRVNLLHAFDHTEIAPFETLTRGWNDLRAELAYTQSLDPAIYGATEVTVGLQGRNLLDDDIRNSASFKKDEILLPGRNVRLFLTARF